MNDIIIEGKVHLGTAESIIVHRGKPPANCKMGCPEYRSKEICLNCYRRPVKSYEEATRPIGIVLDQTGEQIVRIMEVT
jgi:hypothetical protein